METIAVLNDRSACRVATTDMQYKNELMSDGDEEGGGNDRKLSRSL